MMKTSNQYCIIMAGGIGSRFWPMSRVSSPKQFLDILDTGKSFIRETYERFATFIPNENFLVVTNNSYKHEVLRQIPELKIDQILCEPLGRNTAPCVAYAAYRLRMQNPESTMIVTPADHYIADIKEFARVMKVGAQYVANHDSLLTIGIHPDSPATGYGYIQIESENVAPEIHRVKTFTEKPTLEVAQAFLESGEFFWNSGIFIWRTNVIIEAIERFLPEIASLFESISDSYATPSERDAITKIYPECRNISIDYGVMEKATNTNVICADFGWSDIGTWGSLYNHAQKDGYGNVVNPLVLSYNSKGTIVKAPKEKLIVIEGLEDYIVVDKDDVLLICRRENEQNIKQYVEDVKFKIGEEYI